SVVSPDTATRPLLLALARLFVHSAPGRALRRLGRPARSGDDEGAADELGELGARVLEVLCLAARRVALDDDAALGVERGEGAQARLRRVAQRIAAGEVEAKVDLRRHLVDVLAAGARGAHCVKGEAAARDDEARADEEIVHQAPRRGSRPAVTRRSRPR